MKLLAAPGPAREAKAAVAHSAATIADVAANATFDIRDSGFENPERVFRKSGYRFSDQNARSYESGAFLRQAGFRFAGRCSAQMLLHEAGTGSHDPHSSFTAPLFRSHPRRSLEFFDLRCGDAVGGIDGGVGMKAIDSRGRIHMNVTRILGLAAVGGLLLLAAPTERAQALSLASPGAAATVQDGSTQMTTEVRWGHHHRHWGYHRHWGHHRHYHRHWRRW